MNDRRTAADALNDDPLDDAIIRQFVTAGVPSNTDARPRPHESKPATITEQVASDDKREAQIARKRRPENRIKVGAKKRDTNADALPPELRSALSKATVQKTVRFHPKLIAQLDAYTRAEEARGERAKSFQQIQNEALELWLQRNA